MTCSGCGLDCADCVCWAPAWKQWQPADRPYQFNCDCDGMVKAIRRAATPGRYHGVDPSLDMDPTEQAVWFAKYVMRRARNLGLWGAAPEYHQRRTA